jgi:hypothetical protein
MRWSSVVHSGRRAFLSLLLIGLGSTMLIYRANHTQYDPSLDMLAWKWLPLWVIVAGLIRLLWFVRQPWELIEPTIVIVIAILILVGLGLYEPVSPLPTDRLAVLLWPATIILIGVWLIVVPPGPRSATSDDSDDLHIVLWFRGEARKGSIELASGRILVVLGYLQLDLSGSGWDGLCPLDVTVLLGHVRILVSPDALVDKHPAFVLARRGLLYRDPVIVPEDQTLLRISVIGVGGDAEVVRVGQSNQSHH